MKKSLLSLLLAVVMSFTAGEGAFGALAQLDESSGGATPIAKIENDGYVPYESRKADVAEPLGGDGAFEPVTQTIKVMTTATGSVENGNFRASEPVSGALVRIDGVPRFTGEAGTITAPLFREYAELYVERDGYNPYIEIIEADGADKTVYLKAPSDDVEIYNAMFSLYGETFNLAVQPCHYLKNQTETAALLTVDSNVEYDFIWFYVNGRPERFGFSDGIVFTDDDLNGYGPDDKFSLKISYRGVDSETVDLNLLIEEVDAADMKAKLTEACKGGDMSFGAETNNSCGVGSLGTVNASRSKISEAITELIFGMLGESDFKSVNIEAEFSKVKLNFVFDFHKGTIAIIGGINFDLKDTAEKIAKKAREVKENKEKLQAAKDLAKLDELENKMLDAELELLRKEAELEELLEKGNPTKEDIKKKKEELEFVKQKRKNGETWKKSEGYRTFRDERGRFIKSVDGLERELKEAKKQYKEVGKKIKSVQKSAKKADKAVKDYLKKLDEVDLKQSKVKNVFSNGGFDYDLDLSVTATVEFSYTTGKIYDLNANAELDFKLKYSHQWYIVTGCPVLPVVPVYVKFEGTVNFLAEATLVDEESGIEMPVSFGEALRRIELTLKLGIRLDAGVGISGLASAGVYGKVLFTWNIPDSLTFEWGVGLRFELLFFEFEFGYDSDPITIYEKQKAKRLMARSAGGVSSLNASQVFDRIYQSSKPQLLKLKDGRQMMLWIEDDAARDDYNRSVVKFSVLDGGVWSSPQAVYGDGRGDYDFDVYADGDGVYVAMQKAENVVTEKDAIEDVLADTEIYVARYNFASGKFGDVKRLTDNNVYDALPRFAASCDGGVTVLWQTDTDNDCFAATGENEIYSSSLNGGVWSPAVKRFGGNRLIYSYSAAEENGALTLAVCEDADGDIMTCDARTTVIRDGVELLASDASDPRFTVISGKTAMLYRDGDSLKITEDFATAKTVADDVTSYTAAKCGSVPAVFYASYRGGAERGCCAVYADGEWTADISVTQPAAEDGDISSLAGYCDGGGVSCVYNYGEADGGSLRNGYVLCYDRHEFKYSVSTDAYTASRIADGADVKLCLLVENTGDFVINRFNVCVCGQDTEFVLDEPLKVGEGRYFDLPFTADIKGRTHIEIKTAVRGADGAAAEDICLLQAGYTELDTSFTMKTVNGKQQFTVNVKNVSDTDSGFTVKVFVNGVKEREISGFAAASGETEYAFTFEEISEGDYIFIKVFAEKEEFDTDDNKAGFVSLQTEKPRAAEAVNPYRQLLCEAVLMTE